MPLPFPEGTRPIRPDDADGILAAAVASLERGEIEGVSRPFLEESADRLRHEPELGAVAVEGDRVVGWVVPRHDDLTVDMPYRRRGHGTRLIAAGRAMLEIPAGTLDVHDGVTEDPGIAARRELEEETGSRAVSWRRLASFWTAPGFATELMHLYLATGLESVHGDDRLAPDEDERLELSRVTVDEAVALVDRGEISDAKTILGVLWLDRLRRVGELG